MFPQSYSFGICRRRGKRKVKVCPNVSYVWNRRVLDGLVMFDKIIIILKFQVNCKATQELFRQASQGRPEIINGLLQARDFHWETRCLVGFKAPEIKARFQINGCWTLLHLFEFSNPRNVGKLRIRNSKGTLNWWFVGFFLILFILRRGVTKKIFNSISFPIFLFHVFGQSKEVTRLWKESVNLQKFCDFTIYNARKQLRIFGYWVL